MFVWSHERFIAALFGVFSFVALGLAAIGISSVVAYSVEQRTREFGIRMALGAPQWNVLLLTLASTARTTGIGLVLGILLSIALSDQVQKWTESSMRDASVLGVDRCGLPAGFGGRVAAAGAQSHPHRSHDCAAGQLSARYSGQSLATPDNIARVSASESRNVRAFP